MNDMSYVSGISDVPFLGHTIGRALERAAETWGDRTALVSPSQGIRWTWGEFRDRVDAFAAGLLALGLRRGDRIGIWSLNRAEWALTQFAAARAGLVLVTINPAYRLSELEFALNKVGCAALVTATSFKSSDYVGMVQTLAPELAAAVPGQVSAARLPQLRTVIQIGGPRFRARSPSATWRPSAVTPNDRPLPTSPARCSSTTRSTSSSPAAPPARRRA